jgi:hypothetical protein
MSDSEAQLREALARIAEVANAAAGYGRHAAPHNHQTSTGKFIACTPRSLPVRLLVPAANTATKINPMNSPRVTGFAALSSSILPPQAIAVVTTKYWGPTARRLTVSFMETTPADLRAKIVSHMNAWTRTAAISFAETKKDGDVRISREAGGYWSYLGTDILHIPKNRQTMNLEDFTMETPDSEYLRVVRHETGHTLGMPHEHMRKDLIARIDPEKAYAYFLETFNWSKTMVDQQVLTPLDEKTLMATPPDQTSIMCYQLPGTITRDGQPIVGGTDINATDFAFAGKIYPKNPVAPAHALVATSANEWDASEDVYPE